MVATEQEVTEALQERVVHPVTHVGFGPKYTPPTKGAVLTFEWHKLSVELPDGKSLKVSVFIPTHGGREVVPAVMQAIHVNVNCQLEAGGYEVKEIV